MRNLFLVTALLIASRAQGSGGVLVTVTIENAGAHAITGLQLSACDMEAWSEDVLLVAADPDRSIEPGETVTLELPGGTSDLRILVGDGEPLAKLGPLTLADGVYILID